ncbi:uncharacterized protein LOC114465912 isoform X2 [Gouania willdenowi]|uniref:uncharacterized protein LOC114465912 isoform X2 n=1 Tax=Gouania willdenowi TaxID=441366 RepID=UPI001055D71B|nr:uncharacterized protein LOC114465912 isoform X2 [Gouania willdenowi]
MISHPKVRCYFLRVTYYFAIWLTGWEYFVPSSVLLPTHSDDPFGPEEETSTSHVLTKPAMKTFIDSSSSETDLDISEVQTLPVHAGVPVNDGVPVHAGVEAQRREPDQHHSGFMDHEEEEEDDLQLVRDIFFS